ncbi:MAG: DUF3267 domain-containing protein [Anaerolineales bacterium]|nr:DUF3267 domain-containing protein [Anaerolineales bacterium]
MQATKTPPDHYTKSTTLDLSSLRIALLLNLAAVPPALALVWGFLVLARLIRPDLAYTLTWWQILSKPANWLAILLANVVAIILHEAIHGLFFWIYTKSRPIFAFKGAYAYAAAPDWYLPRNKYIVVGITPLILISLASFLLIELLPGSAVPPILVAAALNAAGSLGDVIIIAWALRRSPQALVRDQGEHFQILEPGE